MSKFQGYDENNCGGDVIHLSVPLHMSTLVTDSIGLLPSNLWRHFRMVHCENEVFSLTFDLCNDLSCAVALDVVNFEASLRISVNHRDCCRCTHVFSDGINLSHDISGILLQSSMKNWLQA